MLRLLEIFFLKNSSPFFLKPWRVRASNINILLIGAIKHYNFFYCHFLLRPFLSEMFAGPFHQAKAESSSRTVIEDLLMDTIRSNLWRKYVYRLTDSICVRLTSFCDTHLLIIRIVNRIAPKSRHCHVNSISRCECIAVISDGHSGIKIELSLFSWSFCQLTFSLLQDTTVSG